MAASKGEPKRVLFTGGTGFFGMSIVPILTDAGHTVFSPCRAELDCCDASAVKQYVENNAIQSIVHSANPNPAKNPQHDSSGNMLADSLASFFSVFQLKDNVEQILYFGSGAEFDKRFDVVGIREEDAARSLPQDDYGRAKFVMNTMAHSVNNIRNLRVFGCFGPYDHESKFITHCIRSAALGKDITIRQDCKFDYLHVFDLGRTVDWFLRSTSCCVDYNVASGRGVYLSQIAQIVLEQMHANLSVVMLHPGKNKEYTANIDRLKNETGLPQSYMSLEQGIALQIEHEMKVRTTWDPLLTGR